MNSRPFRFLTAWVEHADFEDFLHQHWNITSLLGPTLKYLATELTQWNREVFGNLFRRKRNIWARLQGVQLQLSASGNGHLIRLRGKLREELNVILNQIETLWFHKSRMEAIQDGNRNTRYFHLSTIIRRTSSKPSWIRIIIGLVTKTR